MGTARLARAGVAVGAGVVHSILMIAAFPPWGFWGSVLLAPLPLIILATRGAGRPLLWTPLLAGLGTVPVWAYEMQWVIPVSLPGYFPLLGALGLLNVLFVWTLMLVTRRWTAVPTWITGPVCWVGVEFLRGEVAFDGCPWLQVAYPLIAAPGAAAPASALGVYFVSFLAASAGCLVTACTARAGAAPGRGGRRLMAGYAAALTLVAALAGLLGSRTIREGRTIHVGIVQTNVPQDNKLGWSAAQRLADWDRMAAMTREAAAATPRPDMIIWPETMFPGEFLDGPSVQAQRRSGLGIPYEDAQGREQILMLTEFVDRLTELQVEVGVPLVIGAMAADNLRFVDFAGDSGRGGGTRIEFDGRYNSAFVVDGGRVLDDRYDKIALTPFGEVMPYISNWPWLEQQLLALGAHGMAFDLSPGRGPATLGVRAGSGPIRLAVPICFEAAKTGTVRDLVRGRGAVADVIVNLTNDGWFGWFDGGRLQALQIARWRAVELGRPVLRAANTGVSCLIDQAGRVVSTARPRTEGVLPVRVTLTVGDTIYSRLGNVFGWSVLAAWGLLALAAGWGEVRSRWRGARSGASGEHRAAE